MVEVNVASDNSDRNKLWAEAVENEEVIYKGDDDQGKSSYIGCECARLIDQGFVKDDDDNWQEMAFIAGREISRQTEDKLRLMPVQAQADAETWLLEVLAPIKLDAYELLRDGQDLFFDQQEDGNWRGIEYETPEEIAAKEAKELADKKAKEDAAKAAAEVKATVLQAKYAAQERLASEVIGRLSDPEILSGLRMMPRKSIDDVGPQEWVQDFFGIEDWDISCRVYYKLKDLGHIVCVSGACEEGADREAKEAAEKEAKRLAEEKAKADYKAAKEAKNKAWRIKLSLLKSNGASRQLCQIPPAENSEYDEIWREEIANQ